MLPLAGRFGVELVGGDTNAWDGPLVISVTVLGEATANGTVRRAGARAGDAILVTGPLGGSLLGRHLRPEPRIAEALALHATVPIRAMIDLSDGLASDLGHILDESGGLGAVLDSAAIPVHSDAHAASRADGRSPLDHALNDGEDFELCLVVDPEAAEILTTSPATSALVSRIGNVLDRPGLWLRSAGGGTSPLERRGFDHFRAGPPADQTSGE
jgi:thiamine-monophosphate kinase